MYDDIINEIEALVGSDYFEYDSEEKINALRECSAGIEAVAPLLQIMERHPLDDFGMPGEMVNFIESFDPEYEKYLVESLRRRPAAHTVWMLNRCINGNPHREEYLALLKEISERSDIEKEISDSAKDFLVFQNNR